MVCGVTDPCAGQRGAVAVETLVAPEPVADGIDGPLARLPATNPWARHCFHLLMVLVPAKKKLPLSPWPPPRLKMQAG